MEERPRTLGELLRDFLAENPPGEDEPYHIYSPAFPGCAVLVGPSGEVLEIIEIVQHLPELAADG